MLNKPTKLVYIPPKIGYKIAQWLPNWKHFNLEQLIKNELDIIVSPNAKYTIKDLFVNPVSLPNGSEFYLNFYKAFTPQSYD